MTAHVRKVGPRGALHDQTEIFRRGVPYLTLDADGTIDAGLQFVSFQRSLNDFAVIFARWMTNVDFPSTAAGSDALVINSLITLKKYGFYFVPPADPRLLGASMFDPPALDPCTVGEIVVQKQLVDANGSPYSPSLAASASGARQRPAFGVPLHHGLDRAGDLTAGPARRAARRARSRSAARVLSSRGRRGDPEL